MVGANNYFGANDFVQKQQINNQKVYIAQEVYWRITLYKV